MNRRRFLNTTMLTAVAAVGYAVSANSAHAFTLQSCGSGAVASACDEVHRHKMLLVELKQQIAKLHLTPAQEQAVLANAVCPVCGGLLIG